MADTRPVDYFDFAGNRIVEIFEILALLLGISGVADSKPERRDSPDDEDWFCILRLCSSASKRLRELLETLDESAFDFERKRTLTPSAGEGDATN